MEATARPRDLDRRKQVRLRVRADLQTTPQKYEGKTHYVVKDPVSLRYYRFNEQEHYVIRQLDGTHTLEETQKSFEKEFRPHRLTLEDLEHFARQLLTAGLVQHESAQAGKTLFDRRLKQRRMRRLAAFTNILYIKLPIFDPDRLLRAMLPYTRFIFTTWFLVLSIGFMLSAVALVATHFQTFYDRLPNYQYFFQFNRLLYMWIALGIVKVIHEFGHGLSCKAFGGECHEMGALFLCFSPCLYCNVSDSWTLPNKWKRILISFAGIYVELVIAAAATWIWWNTPGRPFINNVALCLMVLCSVSTFVFNANPLMRFDGYYMMADWLEIPNLRDRSNRLLSNLFQEKCLGIEVQPEPYMAPRRQLLFVSYAVVSYVYRWVVTFSILYFLYNWLKPYKLDALSALLAIAAVVSMLGWPAYRMVKNIRQRGRLPDMKRGRVTVTAGVLAAVLLAFFLVPLPIARVQDKGLVQVEPENIAQVAPTDSAVLTGLFVQNGQPVSPGQRIAAFADPELENKLLEAAGKTDRSYSDYMAYYTILTQGSSLRPEERKQLQTEQSRARSEYEGNKGEQDSLRKQLENLREVASPRSGYVMSLPPRENVGKLWDKTENPIFCSVGDPHKLQVILPVQPADYKLLTEDLEGQADLPVSIRIPGRGDTVFQGKILTLPTGDSKLVPVQLTVKGGGSLAVKPTDSPNKQYAEPQTQHYLVVVEVLNPDAAICPGTLAQVKVHCRWRTGAWWVWRKLATTFDIGLL
jgi:putative peptide zinc metalloprotease protein